MLEGKSIDRRFIKAKLKKAYVNTKCYIFLIFSINYK